MTTKRTHEYRPGSHVELGARNARTVYRIEAVAPMLTAHGMMRAELVRMAYDDETKQFYPDRSRRFVWIGRKGARIPWNAALADIAPDPTTNSESE